ncbi:hypothetical protein BDF22DRAFT_686358 [Syncephalis plumigaleata]|nr:hypothetical protein BDF22DRAFT_686358 [Syncephalis plumigaleata]
MLKQYAWFSVRSNLNLYARTLLLYAPQACSSRLISRQRVENRLFLRTLYTLPGLLSDSIDTKHESSKPEEAADQAKQEECRSEPNATRSLNTKADSVTRPSYRFSRRFMEDNPELEPFHNDIRNATYNYDIQEAEKAYQELENAKLKPNELTLQLMLRAHLSGIYSRNTGRARTLPWQSLRRMEKLLRTYRRNNKQLVPSQMVYNLMLRAYGCVYPADRHSAWQLYQQMLADGVMPGKRTFGNLITVYMRRTDVEGAERVVEEMRRLKRQPNGVIYSILMHTYVEARRLVDALAIYYRMRTEGVQVNAHIYTELIHAHVKGSDIAEAERMYQRMLVNNVHPTVVTLCELMRGYAKFGNATKAREKFDEFARRKLIPPTIAYNIMLHAYSSKQDETGMAYIMEQLRRSNVQWDIVTYNTLIHWYTNINDIPTAQHYYRELLGAGLQPDNITREAMSKHPSAT